jgi:hypothetical protein
MVMTMNQVVALLNPDEMNHRAAARHGAQLLPHLRTIVAGSNVALAARAAVLAGHIDDPGTPGVLAVAARHASPVVRVAAANAMRAVRRPAVVATLLRLLDDRDIGVRKFAIKASVQQRDPRLQAKVATLGAGDPSPALRQIAMAALGGGGRRPGSNGSRIA